MQSTVIIFTPKVTQSQCLLVSPKLLLPWRTPLYFLIYLAGGSLLGILECLTDGNSHLAHSLASSDGKHLTQCSLESLLLCVFSWVTSAFVHFCLVSFYSYHQVLPMYLILWLTLYLPINLIPHEWHKEVQKHHQLVTIWATQSDRSQKPPRPSPCSAVPQQLIYFASLLPKFIGKMSPQPLGSLDSAFFSLETYSFFCETKMSSLTQGPNILGS